MNGNLISIAVILAFLAVAARNLPIILKKVRTVAETRGFKNFAESADLNRENLYRVLSEGGNPRLDTFFKILDALELRLSVEPKTKAE